MLISNELGDNQLDTYFEYSDHDGSMICEEKGKEEIFDKIKKIQHKSFENIGGTYIERNGEKTCVIRLSTAVFFKVTIRLLVAMTVCSTCSDSYYPSSRACMIRGLLSTLRSPVYENN